MSGGKVAQRVSKWGSNLEMFFDIAENDPRKYPEIDKVRTFKT
jgi:hypothetical protein